MSVMRDNNEILWIFTHIYLYLYEYIYWEKNWYNLLPTKFSVKKRYFTVQFWAATICVTDFITGPITKCFSRDRPILVACLG